MAFYNSKKVLQVSSSNVGGPVEAASVLLEGVNKSIPIWTIGGEHNSTITMLTIALTTNSLVSVETRTSADNSERIVKVTMASDSSNSTGGIKATEKLVANN